MTSDVWVPLVSALGASLVTGGLTFGLVSWQHHITERDQDEDAKRAVFVELLTVAMLVMNDFVVLESIAKATSKWLHGWNQLLKAAPAQPTMMEIHTHLTSSLTRLAQVSSQAWLILDREEIEAVNVLTGAVQKAINLGPDEGSPQDVVMAARVVFAEFARPRIGETAIKVANSVARLPAP